MNISSRGLQIIKDSEGLRSNVYNDVAGYPTIGYGHKLTVTEIASGIYSHGITEADATTLLQSDVVDAQQAVGRLVKVPLTQGQFDALVDWVFNLGSGRLASSALLKCLNAGRNDDAVEQLLLWTHAGGKECSALVKRREAEAVLWRESSVPDAATAPAA